jgi:hypothetical protein
VGTGAENLLGHHLEPALFGDELEEDDSTLAVDDLEIPEGSAPERRKIFTDKSDPPSTSLYTRYKSGDLVLDMQVSVSSWAIRM